MMVYRPGAVTCLNITVIEMVMNICKIITAHFCRQKKYKIKLSFTSICALSCNDQT